MKKVNEFLRSKAVKVSAAASAVATGLLVAASAVEGEISNATIMSSFTTGFQQIASDAVAMIAVIVPIGLGIAGSVFLAKRAIGWFKSLSK